MYKVSFYLCNNFVKWLLIVSVLARRRLRFGGGVKELGHSQEAGSR